jgi:mannosyltransferase OCH1-like enzyme
MISDFMRWEIIYRHGGFYYDTNYEAFKTLDEFRGYPFVGISME